MGALKKKKNPEALGTCPVCPLVKTAMGFTFLVPAHPGSPGQRAVKRVCVYTATGGMNEWTSRTHRVGGGPVQVGYDTGGESAGRQSRSTSSV